MKLIYSDNMDRKQSDSVRLISKKLIGENFGRIGDMQNIHLCNIPKTHNRFAHVFWSRPALLPYKQARWNIGNQFEQTLALAALSVACLKGLNQEVVLYTDNAGASLLADLGYDRVYVVLDKLNVPDDFWAAGKIFALQNEPLDSCIIDTDIFLYDGDLIDRLSCLEIAASHRENTAAYKQLIEFGQTHFPHLAGANEYSSNTGFMKISDFRLKQMFISAYFDCMTALGNEALLNQLKIIGKGAFCADLICEQFNFHKICKPKHLVTVGDDATTVSGFTHLLSFEKYIKLPVVLSILENQFPDYYDMVIAKWKDYEFSVEVE